MSISAHIDLDPSYVSGIVCAAVMYASIKLTGS